MLQDRSIIQTERSNFIHPDTPPNKKAQNRNIDVVTLDPNDGNNDDTDTAYSASSRVIMNMKKIRQFRTVLIYVTPFIYFKDEHGQSMLHFAAARSHSRNALFQLLQEMDINIGYRDELYRTARDVSIQANIPDNLLEIDRYVISIAAKGEQRITFFHHCGYR